MSYSADEVISYVEKEDVKFIKLTFCDVFGRQKNISIMPRELKRAFVQGIPFDASAVRGFDREIFSDLFLKPDPSTLSVLVWRPQQGKVARMYCTVTALDGKEFACDTRSMFLRAVNGYKVGKYVSGLVLKPRFRLFKPDGDGKRTSKPFDKAGSFDVAPLDGGENIRRQVCLTLERMGIFPRSSFHTEISGQHEISFSCGDILRAADDIMLFTTVVKTSASVNGLCAEFSTEHEGGGSEIEITAANRTILTRACEGISARISEAAQLLCFDSKHRMSAKIKDDSLIIRLPDLEINPYLVFSLMIHAAAESINGEASQSGFVQRHVPEGIINAYRTLQKVP